jgi:hypothetical protein
MALDSAHQQIFTAWPFRDRVDVLSTVDYHLIYSIAVPSPSTLDISPDGTTLAVGTSSSHILFFDTGTFAKTNDIVFPDSALGISAFLYAANGNAMIRAEEGISTGGGITAYWNAASNSFQSVSNVEMPSSSTYSPTGPLARSGDYSKFILGDASSGGAVQIIDANSGQILFSFGEPYGTFNPAQTPGFGGYIDALAANIDGSRYAVCVEPAGVGPYLVILDSTFDEIYQDQEGCIGITFSGDGQSLYRNVSVNGTGYTQVLDMTAFTASNVPTYQEDYMFWEASDTSGMVYGVSPQIGSQTAGGEILWIALDTTASTDPPIPPADDSLQIVHVIDNIGSPQGGDTIRMLCMGVGSAATVTIGGVPATNVSITTVGNTNPPLAGLAGEVMVTLTTPAGNPGPADVALSSNGSTTTSPNGFEYAMSRTIFPFATSPTFLAFDSLRNRLYAAHQNQVEVIDVASKTVLAPLVPVSGKLANSQFAGISLSPDQNRLYIADAGANMIHMLNLASPGTGFSLNLGNALGTSSPVSPGRVFELSNGELLGSTWGGYGQVFLIDPNTQTGDWAEDGLGNPIQGLAWGTANQGANVILSYDSGGEDSSSVGLWSVNAATNSTPANEIANWPEFATNEDGTLIAAGGGGYTPELMDFNEDTLGFIYQTFDVPLPSGTPSLLFHPSGALLYSAGTSNSYGFGPGASTVQIEDINQWQPIASVALPEPLVQVAYGNNAAFVDHMLAIDPTGGYLFGVTQSGITMMQLYSVPLSIGNVQPASFGPQSGTTVTVRGSGFVSGAEVSIGGTQAATTYVDADTLTATVPEVNSGWQNVTVILPSGASYTAASLLQIVGSQPTPVITGFSPAGAGLQGECPAGFETTESVTVVGSGFANYDTVDINGEQVLTSFTDSGDIQATIPAGLTCGEFQSLTVTVVSPYTGASNTASLPVVNPVPVLASGQTNTYSPGEQMASYTPGLNLSLEVLGSNFNGSSIIQWNGQNVPATPGPGEADGYEVLQATIPSTLTQTGGDAVIAVYNPPPGGGLSGSLTVYPAPLPLYSLVNPATSAVIAQYESVPASLDLGSQLTGTSNTVDLNVASVGPGTPAYSIASFSLSSGPFSTTQTSCQPLNLIYCTIPLTFSPTTTGPQTAVLTVTDNLPGSPHSIQLTGEGTQTLVPAVTLTYINALFQTITATVQGSAVVGGNGVPATAWIEYGTDQTLSTYTQSPSWTFTGDGPVSGNLTLLSPNTLYAVRIAVQTAGGIGKSAIHLFSTIAAPPWVEFSVAQGASSTATVTAGQTATYSLVVSDGGNGYSGTASFSCGIAPTGAACTVSPSQVTVGLNPSPITVTITTTGAQTAAAGDPGSASSRLAVCFALAFVFLVNRRRLRFLYMAFLAVVLIGACTSCGGSGSAGGGGTSVQSTPPGTYYLTVTGTVGDAQNTCLLQLTVQ